MVTPFAVLEPVLVGGVTITYRDAAQRGRGPPQGRARGRHGDRSARRRRDPRDRRAGARLSARRARGSGSSRRRVPRAGPRSSGTQGEADRRCPNSASCPSRTSSGCTQLRLARWSGHRGSRLHDRDGAARPRDREGPGRHLHPDGRGPRPAPGVRRQVDLEPAGVDRAGEGPPALAAADRAQHPPRRHARRPGARERVRLDRRADGGVGAGHRRCGGDRPRDREERPRLVRRPRQPPADREAPRRGRADEGRGEEEAQGQAAARRQDASS